MHALLFILALLTSASAQEAPGDVESDAPEASESPAETEDSEQDPAETAPEAEPPPTFEIPPLEAPLPSATRTVKDLEAITSDPEELERLMEEAGFEPGEFAVGSLVRGRWYVRPRFSVTSLFRPDEGGSGVRMGFSAGRRFWTLEDLPVQLAADIGVHGTAPIGAANGRRLGAHAAIGPWLGPARIQLEAGARWERERWIQKQYELQDAGLVTFGASVAFDFRQIQLNVGFTPAFRVAGERARATSGDPVFPVLGTETEWRAGLGVPINPIGLAFDVTWRDTAIGGILDVGLNIQFTPRRRGTPKKGGPS